MRACAVATAALIGIGLNTTGVQAADKVTLEMSGSSRWFTIGSWNNATYAKATGQSFNKVDVKGQADIIFSGFTKLDNGLEVGIETALLSGANTGIGGDDEQNLVDMAYLYIDSGYGKLHLGVLQNGTYLIHVQAPEAIGQWNDGGLLTDNQIIQTPDTIGINGNQLNSTAILPGQSGAFNESVTYITPTFYGLTAVASYTPNDIKNVRGPVNLKTTMHDFFGAGLNYTDSFDGFGVKASAAWARASIGPEWGIVAFTPGQYVNFYNAGLNLSYGGFTLGGSLRWNNHNEKGHGLADQLSLDGHAWDAGLVYGGDVWTAGVSLYKSRVTGHSYRNGGKKEEITFIQTSASYTLGPGVSLQGLVGYGDYKASTAGHDPRGTRYGNVNRGWAALGGVAIEF